jgi:major membrane immunogen (membrane-anchored lipoprotein)
VAPFEFSKKLSKLLEQRNKDTSEAEGEGGDSEGESGLEDHTSQTKIATNIRMNEVTEYTTNPVILKFLKAMCEYKTVVYSELESLIIKGMFGDIKTSDSYASEMSREDYFEVMEETEALVSDFEDEYESIRTFNKEFNLSILFECFQNNKIDILPIYLRLFTNSMEHKDNANLTTLVKQGKLISMFYKGIYQNEFIKQKSPDSEFEDDEMDDSADLSLKIHHETLVNQQFVEELEEAMSLHNNNSDFKMYLNTYLEDSLLYTSSVDESGLATEASEKLGSYLIYKKYPYVSQLLSLLILIETRGDLTPDQIQSVFEQKFGSSVDIKQFL